MEANMKYINKEIMNKVLKHLNKSTDIHLEYDNDNYIIEYQEYIKLKNEFNLLIRFKEKELNKNAEYINFDKYDDLKKKYESMIYNEVRNRFDHLEDTGYSDEELFNIQLEILSEVNNILLIKEMIKDIKSKIEEIKKHNLSYSINSIEYTFNNYLTNGASFEQYNILNMELNEIIKRTYKNNISYIMPVDYITSNVLINENNTNYIMNKNNLYNFSYGYIIHPKYITFVTNEGDNKFLPFNSVDKNNAVIKTKDSKPLGVYAITLGEKSLNQNYREALKLQKKYMDIPLIDIDLTKIFYSEEIKDYRNNLIDNLINDKGIEIKEKNDNFYDRFSYFFNEFSKLKMSNYNQGNIINLFDYCFDLIFSQKYVDLNNLLTDRLSIDSIKDVLENNIFYDFNIFKNKNINKQMVIDFKEKFLEYKDNKYLNIIYPGINNILSYIKEADDIKINRLIDIINNTNTKDTWLIAETLNPTHKISKEENTNNRLNEIKGEKEDAYKLLEKLKSLDNNNNTRK